VAYDKVHGRRAGAVMTQNVITVDEDNHSTKSPNC
jgi:hypothetical protein